ncbi:DUF3224 domain-containing protein [Nakamurella sp.]|uniref:DUF3224 domain-containing protein n=1 Tax=Nakamurella sp. TaxID=1869182 RepID=UPI003B3B9085
MKVELALPFTITTWEGAPDPAPAPPELAAGAPDLAAVVLAKTYAGPDVAATATGHAVTTRGDRGASYVAQERIVGTVHGRTGSFVLEHGASMGEGIPTELWARVVVGSGTGGFTGLTGTGLVEHELVTLRVDWPAEPAG